MFIITSTIMSNEWNKTYKAVFLFQKLVIRVLLFLILHVQ